jgi:hypothetical protein
MTSALIVGTSYVHGAAAAEIFSMWAALIRRLNPGVDVLVLDSCSPTPLPVDKWTRDFDCISLSDNIGHLTHGGLDGWGRVFSLGVAHAIKCGYDWLANIECDLLLARPVEEIFAKMVRANVKCCAPMAMPYQFTETACSFWSVPYLREIDLIGKYDWRNQPPNGLLPEQRIDAICADEMFALPLRGMRNDTRVSADQLRRMFPTGIDWIHHAEIPVLRAFLEMNGHA